MIGDLFVRFESADPSPTGHHTGIFGLVNGLARSGVLTPPELATWRASNDWFNSAYPDPGSIDPSIYDRSVNPRSTAWFKASAVHLLARIPPYVALLEAHDIAWRRLDSTNPGRVIYEDDVQVIVA